MLTSSATSTVLCATSSDEIDSDEGTHADIANERRQGRTTGTLQAGEGYEASAQAASDDDGRG